MGVRNGPQGPKAPQSTALLTPVPLVVKWVPGSSNSNYIQCLGHWVQSIKVTVFHGIKINLKSQCPEVCFKLKLSKGPVIIYDRGAPKENCILQENFSRPTWHVDKTLTVFDAHSLQIKMFSEPPPPTFSSGPPPLP